MMMAGTGVSVGGAGMLRARRRDVSVKPNRKLDRKSSRGMIYENEELRLRTIHINAEVEQGQNDIKKLRRENEQLRREIWSLRDEYDKLEEILKGQKSRGDSEDYEDPSDEDDGLQSDYSFEDDEQEAEDEDTKDSSKECNKAEQLENAENQKISSEKMTNSLHRLHVDFDDLSVVDEEEELKKDKEKKEVSSEDGQQAKERTSPLSIMKPRQLHENIPFYPGTYEPPSAMSTSSYFAECPFQFPSPMNLMIPTESTGLLASTCPTLQSDSLLTIPNLNVPGVDQLDDSMLHAPPAGWQSNIMMPQNQITPFGAPETVPSGLQSFGPIRQDQTEQHRFGTTTPGFSNFSSLLQRRNVGSKQPGSFFNATPFTESKSEKLVLQNGWGFEDSCNSKGLNDQISAESKKKDAEENLMLQGPDKPKHFFAPLPSKLRKQTEDSSPTISHSGTGNSSSSGKTGSTVMSKSPLVNQKGSADVYVNGAIPHGGSFQGNRVEQMAFLSTDNFLIAEVKSNTSNQLTKSLSCQDLTSESQSGSMCHAEGRQQMTQSDNTLDNISDSKPYKSHLSVTLRRPKFKETLSRDTPEIPKLPSMDYRLLKNPFLRTFEPNSYLDQNNATRPLSVQVADDNVCYYSPQPEVPTFNRGVRLSDRYRPVQPDQNRLLMPSNQLINGKLMSPANKHEIQVTSFERPSPHTLVGPSTQYEFNTLRRLNTNPYLQSQNLYQNIPFVPRGGLYPQRGMMYYDNLTLKVPAQTQTSIDGDSHHEEEQNLSQEESAPSTPSGQRRRRIRKEKSGLMRKQEPASPAVQNRLKKQSSVISSEIPESPGKPTKKRPLKLSITPTTTSEGPEDKNESRSSSSGQDSPKKDQMRRVSLYFNAKKRPSLASVKTARSGSFDVSREKEMSAFSERERTNSVSSRETAGMKARKASTSSGNVPWCACWGNGCI